MKQNLEGVIVKTLLNLGISPNIKGYRYLRDSIFICVTSDNKNLSFNKDIYMRIAKEYNTTEASMERAVRHAIKTGWHRHNDDLAELIFMNTLQSTNDVPTNSVFIYTVSEWIRVNIQYSEENGSSII
ncbi:sporulation initiation factor Spo0A C-terminal domain-containing protein [Ruminococcus flavefaciens]|nr:sporulation initiation factor Spo0A C-terminal domain-containing protein [Ruminococcus flavefaciens]